MHEIAFSLEGKLRQLIKLVKADLEQDYLPGADFKDQLGLDSLDLAEFVARIEQTFRIEIEDKDWEGLRNISVCASYVEKKLEHAAV